MNKMNSLTIEFLEEKVSQYQNSQFIETDPIQVPHKFSKKEDIEISGFLTSIISWGNRKSIVKSANKMMNCLEGVPFDFVMNHSKNDIKSLQSFVHRTFQGVDLIFCIQSLRNIYMSHGGLESAFSPRKKEKSVYCLLDRFYKVFFSISFPNRTKKHLSQVAKNSACKRLNMFLRWMVRDASAGVDFNIWTTISPKILSIPLDVHSGCVARKLGLLKRKQNDWKAVQELDATLRAIDAKDPVKFDFALFGLGVFENF